MKRMQKDGDGKDQFLHLTVIFEKSGSTLHLDHLFKYLQSSASLRMNANCSFAAWLQQLKSH